MRPDRSALVGTMIAALAVAIVGCSGSAGDERADGTVAGADQVEQRPAEGAGVHSSGADVEEGDEEGEREPAAPIPPDPVGPVLEPDPTPAGSPLPEGVSERPDWLGQRALPERDDGHGQAQPTPEALVDRRLATPERPEGMPAPHGEEFAASVSEVPDDVAERSTWRPGCPVGLDELRYVTVTFWGFDERPHIGELLLHERVADDVAAVFAELYEARFPIEEMRVVRADELDAPPTGDGNNTTGFVCRDIAGASDSWSQHAYGLAVDVNPFHNPYVRGDLVIPELAEAYADRADDRPGMIHPGDFVVEAFARIGWGWGGDWRSLYDPMHFSESGR